MEITAATHQRIEALREEIREAEDICRAIREGEVDAVLVGRQENDKRVLLMSGAYARYRQIVEDMQQGAVTVNATGSILFANYSFAAMVGETVVDLFHTGLDRWIEPADRERLTPLLRPRAGEDDVELRVRTPSGPHRVRFAVVAVSDDFVTLLLTDLDAVDEAADTLNAIRSGQVDAFVVGDAGVHVLDSVNAPYRAVVEHMKQGAVTVDATGLITFANDTFLHMVKAAPELLGTPLAALVAPGDQATLASLLRSDGAQAELQLRCADGSRPVVEVSVTLLEDVRLLLFSDVTLQKRHEATDARTRKFLGLLAHELRNILSPINNTAARLKKSADADTREAAEMIERNATKMLALVEDLRRVNPKE